jgi:D-alanyl-D-alanine carboxypeptidase (penicillin-binding protein 5/6)
MRRLLGLLVAGVLMVSAAAVPAAAQTDEAGQPAAWAVFDLDRGLVLDGANLHEARPVAGLVKLMTALTALQRLPYDAVVTTGEETANVGGTRIGVGAQEEWALVNLLRPMLLLGADDAAYGVAEGAAGSLEAFAQDMTTVGQTIGLEDSTFHDPSGLEGEEGFGGSTTMSAYDLGVVGRNVLAVPDLAADIVKTNTLYVDAGVEIGITNQNSFVVSFPGATGLRQSQSVAAGGTIAASASRNGRNLLVVALGTEDPTDFAAQVLDEQFAAAPDAAGTGEELPGVRLSTAQLNSQAITALPHPLGSEGIALGPPGAITLATPDTTPATAAPAPEESGGGGGGILTWTNVGLLLLVLITVVLLLRRRAIVRDQRRRAAGQERFHNARRRKSIDIIETQTHDAGGHVNVIRR